MGFLSVFYCAKFCAGLVLKGAVGFFLSFILLLDEWCGHD
jgi:hypothetical protein